MIDAVTVGLLGAQLQAELLAHHARKEAADRVLLPAGCLHDSGDRCPFGLPEQSEDGCLFGVAAGRTHGLILGLPKPFRAGLGGRRFGLCGNFFTVRHFLDPFRLRRHYAPSPPKPRNGTIASGAGSRIRPTASLGTATVTLSLPQKSTPFCEKN
jgi:hypothetical protein